MPSKFSLCATFAGVALCAIATPAAAGPVVGTDVLYTSGADFGQGTAVNLNTSRVPDQLQLNERASTFPRIWIAQSARGTITRLDTVSGAILGEYRTAPQNQGSNPSRTTVSLDGSAWAGNRAGGAVVHVGNVDANQCVDRNGNGTIETSTGYGDVRPWPNGSGVDDDGGVETAADECIIHYVRTSASAVRHVSVAPDGNLWVSGRFGVNDAKFDNIDTSTGQILRTEGPFACGGYGGLVDGAGIVWSASSGGGVLRWDPAQPLGPQNPRCLDIENYGMALDLHGNVWIGQFSGNLVHKVAPDGTVLGSFAHGSNSAQGLTADANGHIWVSSSLSGGTTVGHLLNDGTHVGNVTGAGNGSTGVAVDAAGKIWTANINSSDATRIDPAAGPDGNGGFKVGAVDLTVPFPASPPDFGAGNPYNYSDMTGNVLLGSTAPQGTWTVVQDGGSAGHPWARVVATLGAPLPRQTRAAVPGGDLTLEVRAADTLAGLGGAAFSEVGNDAPFDRRGRFLELRLTLRPNSAGDSPTVTSVRVCDASGCRPAAAPAPAAAAPTTTAAAAPKRSCASRRSFRIQVRRFKGVRYRAVWVEVDGKAVRVRKRGGRHTALVDLRSQRRRIVTVKIRAVTRDRRVLTGTRRYRTCTRKLVSRRPPKL